MATGDFSGNLAVWDLETMKQEKSVNAHSDVLTCISSSKSFSNILTGKVFFCTFCTDNFYLTQISDYD